MAQHSMRRCSGANTDRKKAVKINALPTEGPTQLRKDSRTRDKKEEGENEGEQEEKKQQHGKEEREDIEQEVVKIAEAEQEKDENEEVLKKKVKEKKGKKKQKGEKRRANRQTEDDSQPEIKGIVGGTNGEVVENGVKYDMQPPFTLEMWLHVSIYKYFTLSVSGLLSFLLTLH